MYIYILHKDMCACVSILKIYSVHGKDLHLRPQKMFNHFNFLGSQHI